MMKNLFIVSGILVAALVASSVAHAIPEEPSTTELDSPALQLAHRVAAMENGKDLPSRAVWLSKKAASTTLLAYQSKPAKKTSKKKIPKVED